MIDWVSIVRHSRRRFSNYMYGVPNKVRRKRRIVRRPVISNGTNSTSAQHTSNCSCCWSDKVEKSRYAEEDMPPPPSPPLLRETVPHDGISRQGSLERGGRRKSSIDRDQIIKETHKPVSQINSTTKNRPLAFAKNSNSLKTASAKGK